MPRTWVCAVAVAWLALCGPAEAKRVRNVTASELPALIAEAESALAEMARVRSRVPADILDVYEDDRAKLAKALAAARRAGPADAKYAGSDLRSAIPSGQNWDARIDKYLQRMGSKGEGGGRIANAARSASLARAAKSAKEADAALASGSGRAAELTVADQHTAASEMLKAGQSADAAKMWMSILQANDATLSAAEKLSYGRWAAHAYEKAGDYERAYGLVGWLRQVAPSDTALPGLHAKYAKLRAPAAPVASPAPSASPR